MPWGSRTESTRVNSTHAPMVKPAAVHRLATLCPALNTDIRPARNTTVASTNPARSNMKKYSAVHAVMPATISVERRSNGSLPSSSTGTRPSRVRQRSTTISSAHRKSPPLTRIGKIFGPSGSASSGYGSASVARR